MGGKKHKQRVGKKKERERGGGGGIPVHKAEHRVL